MKTYITLWNWFQLREFKNFFWSELRKQLNWHYFLSTTFSPVYISYCAIKYFDFESKLAFWILKFTLNSSFLINCHHNIKENKITLLICYFNQRVCKTFCPLKDTKLTNQPYDLRLYFRRVIKICKFTQQFLSKIDLFASLKLFRNFQRLEARLIFPGGHQLRHSLLCAFPRHYWSSLRLLRIN